MGRPQSQRPSPPRQHPRSGQWYTLWRREFIQLGSAATPRADVERAYAKLLERIAADPDHGRSVRGSVSIADLAVQFLRTDESPRSKRQRELYVEIVALLKDAFDGVPPSAADFNADDYRELKRWLLDQGRWSRESANAILRRVRRLLRFGLSCGYVQAERLAMIQAVGSLAIGRESRKVRPAGLRALAAAMRQASTLIADMVRVQYRSGMRAGELVTMRPCDLDTSGPVWWYRPELHKTSHRGKAREIPLGPRVQSILRRRWPADEQSVFFRPADAVIERRGVVTAGRMRAPGDQYTTATYRRAIERACERAGVPKLTPHQIRHAAGTSVRARLGLEHARAFLGHSVRAVTEQYSLEVDRKLAAEAVASSGPKR